MYKGIYEKSKETKFSSEEGSEGSFEEIKKRGNMLYTGRRAWIVRAFSSIDKRRESKRSTRCEI